MYDTKQKDIYLISSEEKYDIFFTISNLLYKTKNVVFLNGDIGAGKTTFVKKFILNFDQNKNAYSPTFSIMNEYNVNGREIFHYDLYRIKSVRELQEIGLDSHFEREAIHFVEWPNDFRNILPNPDLEIYFREYSGLRLLTVEHEK
tara:strand:- start:2011 stop:2448 length:438 start_codon:yes stop_codon:yes gene_type:complete